jgi:hypothetical protein
VTSASFAANVVLSDRLTAGPHDRWYAVRRQSVYRSFPRAATMATPARAEKARGGPEWLLLNSPGAQAKVGLGA